METFYNLLLVFIAVGAVYDRFVAEPNRRKAALRKQHWDIERARQDGTWGPLRIESHRGQLSVVGMGKRHLVNSKAEGEKLIKRIWQDIARICQPPVRKHSAF